MWAIHVHLSCRWPLAGEGAGPLTAPPLGNLHPPHFPYTRMVCMLRTTIAEVAGRIGILVNNAGMSHAGASALTPPPPNFLTARVLCALRLTHSQVAGRIDILVNNAGMSHAGALADLPTQHFHTSTAPSQFSHCPRAVRAAPDSSPRSPAASTSW